MTLHLPGAAYKAMAVQKSRSQKPRTLQDEIDDLRVKLGVALRERDDARAEVERLNAENDKLALKAHRARKVSADGAVTGQFHDGVEYVNQVQACVILGMDPKKEQYRISRWVKDKKFEMIAVPGHKKLQIVAASLTKPERGKPGRKKK